MRILAFILFCILIPATSTQAQFPHADPNTPISIGELRPVVLFSLHGGDDYSKGFGFGAGVHYYATKYLALRTRAVIEWNTLVPRKDQLHPNSDATMLRMPLEVMLYPGSNLVFAYTGASYQHTLALDQHDDIPNGYNDKMFTYGGGIGATLWHLTADLGLQYSAYEQPSLRLMVMWEFY